MATHPVPTLSRLGIPEHQPQAGPSRIDLEKGHVGVDPPPSPGPESRLSASLTMTVGSIHHMGIGQHTSAAGDDKARTEGS